MENIITKLKEIGFIERSLGEYIIEPTELFYDTHPDLIKYNKYIELYIDFEQNKISILWQPEFLFQGRISSPVELETLCKQLGINEKTDIEQDSNNTQKSATV